MSQRGEWEGRSRGDKEAEEAKEDEESWQFVTAAHSDSSAVYVTSR